MGGGFNPAPNGSIITPRRTMGHNNTSPQNNQLPSLQVTKLPAISLNYCEKNYTPSNVGKRIVYTI